MASPQDVLEWQQAPDRGPVCGAISEISGQPCKRLAMEGSPYCKLHSPKEAQPASILRRATKEKLFELLEEASVVLAEGMRGEATRTQIAAALAVLDRAGFGAQSSITVEDKTTQELDELETAELVKRAEEVREQLISRMKPESKNVH